MNNNWLILSFLIIIVLFSGCSNQPDGSDGKPVYSDNALALLDYKTKTNLYYNEETWIEFWITNQVENDIKNIDVKLFNPNVFTLTKIVCESEEKTGDSCHFDKIPTGEARRIQIFLKAPSKEQIGELENSYKVDMSVQYDYEGESICYFRILSLEKESTKTKIQLTQTTGPVKVNIEPGFLIEEKTDKGTKTISDWTIEGKPFNIKISTKNIGTTGSDYEFPELNLTDFKIFLENVKPDTSSCDFRLENNYLTNGNIIVPTKKPLTCILIPDSNFNEPEITGMIRTQYSYRYKLIKTETFKIQTVE